MPFPGSLATSNLTVSHLLHAASLGDKAHRLLLREWVDLQWAQKDRRIDSMLRVADK